MINGINTIETGADVERALIAALLDEHMEDLMKTIPSKNEHVSYICDGHVMMTVAIGEMKDLTVEEVDCIYTECTQAEVRNQKEKTLVDILQLGKSAAPNKIKTASARFQETIVIELFSRRAADKLMSQSLRRWSQSGMFKNAVLKRVDSNPFFILPMAGFIKGHVNSTIMKCTLTQLYSEKGKVGEKEVPLPPSRSLSGATVVQIHGQAQKLQTSRKKERKTLSAIVPITKKIETRQVKQVGQCKVTIARKPRSNVGYMRWKKEPHNRQDYPVRRIFHLFVETQRSETHLRS